MRTESTAADIQNGHVTCSQTEALLTFDLLRSSEELLQRNRCVGAPRSKCSADTAGLWLSTAVLGKLLHAVTGRRERQPWREGSCRSPCFAVWEHECVCTQRLCPTPHSSSVFVAEFRAVQLWFVVLCVGTSSAPLRSFAVLCKATSLTVTTY